MTTRVSSQKMFQNILGEETQKNNLLTVIKLPMEQLQLQSTERNMIKGQATPPFY